MNSLYTVVLAFAREREFSVPYLSSKSMQFAFNTHDLDLNKSYTLYSDSVDYE